MKLRYTLHNKKTNELKTIEVKADNRMFLKGMLYEKYLNDDDWVITEVRVKANELNISNTF